MQVTLPPGEKHPDVDELDGGCSWKIIGSSALWSAAEWPSQQSASMLVIRLPGTISMLYKISVENNSNGFLFAFHLCFWTPGQNVK